MHKQEYIEELIRKVTSIVAPGLYDQTLDMISHKEKRNSLCDKYPKCFISMPCGNKDPLMLPVCNNQGLEDLKMIRFSIQLLERMRKHFEDIDQEKVDKILFKLKRLESKFLKDVPKPASASALKAKSTIKFKNNVTVYLDKIRNG